MSAQYPHVFSPVKIGPIGVKNRFYFGPHGNPLSANSSPSDYFAYYYAERAAGGVGLEIVSLPLSHRQIGRMCPTLEESIPSFATMAEMIHEHGTKVFGQVHCSRVTANWQWEPIGPLAPTISPSPQQRFDHYGGTHEMSRAEIRAMMDAFRRAARNLRSAGFDGVEVHVTHGMLGEQFLSPYFNRRTDEYGGSLNNRLRMPAEMLEAVREGCGPGMAVGMRYNCDELVPGGMTQDDSREALGRLVERGLLDFVDLDIAIEPEQFRVGMPSYFLDKFTYEPYVASVRPAAGNKVIVLSALGRITSVADAERVLADGTVDLVGAVRGLLAEPDLVKNALEGNEHKSRTCIACNMCTGGGTPPGFFGCVINPASAREKRWGARTLVPAPHRRKVVVVGGGPAGLEAARLAALRGHSVTLFEKQDRLGGQLNLWSLLPDRRTMATPIEWYAARLDELRVDVRTGVTASVETVLREGAEAVLIATGSRYDHEGAGGFMPALIPGFDRDFVFTPEQILGQGITPKGNVLVLDDEGINTGAGIAELLAQKGARVELVTRWSGVVPHLFKTIEYAVINPRLKRLGVTATTEMYVKSIGDHTVVLFDVFTNSEEMRTDVDAVVLVTRRVQVSELESQLEGKVDQVFAIGDALAPRGLSEATYEGHRFARLIGEDDAPRNFLEAYWERISPDAFQRPAASLRAPVAAR